MIGALEAAPKLPSELDFACDFEGGTDLILLTDVFVRLGLNKGPEALEAREPTLLATFTDTVDFVARDLKWADLVDPALDNNLATGAAWGTGGTPTGDKATLGDDFWV